MYASAAAKQIHYLSRFYFCFLLAMAGNIGITLAADAVSFYSFFALMSFAAYGMIVSDDERLTTHAGRIYITFVIIGEVMLFSALVRGSQASGTVSLLNAWSIGNDSLAAALIIFGFGIKAGALPFHFILPIVYRAAIPPAVVALAGAMLNAGLLGWLRFLPLGQEGLPILGATLMTLGLCAAFYAVAVGLIQDNAKALLGYSSVSQMGLMTCAVGLALVAPNQWNTISTVLMIYAMQHALAKAALFYAVTLPDAKSAGRLLWQRFALLLPALAISGAPFTSGAIAKDALKSALIAAPPEWSQWFSVLLPLSAIATALLMLRLLVLKWSRRDTGAIMEALPMGQLLLILALLLLPTLWMSSGYVTFGSIKTIVNATWPLLAAGALGYLAVFVLQPRWHLDRWRLPPGDVWVWVERGLSRLQICRKKMHWSNIRSLAGEVRKMFEGVLLLSNCLGKVESWLRTPQVVGMVAALIFIALLLTMQQ